jgi:hypothetical protein
MSDDNRIGGIIDKDDVVQAVLTVYRVWLPSYLAETERIKGLVPGKLPPPRTLTAKNYRPENWPEQSLPLVLAISPGLASRPEKDGRWTHRCKWRVDSVVVVSANEEGLAERNVGMYAAALRVVLLQRSGLDGALGGNVRGTEWADEGYNDIFRAEERTIKAARVTHLIDVGNVADSAPGWTEPPDDPIEDPGPWPVVEETPPPDVEHMPDEED